MKYSIKVNKIRNGSENAKGIVSMTLGDSFKVNSIMIMKNLREPNKLFVSMPSYKDSQGEFREIVHPTTKEFHDELYGNILDAYRELTENQAKNSYTVEYDKRDSKMPEFAVRVTPYEKQDSALRGLASITFNGLVVNNVTIRQDKERLFVSMPAYKTNQKDAQGKDVYKDICHPVTAKFRDKLYGAILQEYEAVKEQQKTASKDSVKGKLNKNMQEAKKSAEKAGDAKEQQHKRDEVER